jgi:hypothetical protein
LEKKNRETIEILKHHFFHFFDFKKIESNRKIQMITNGWAR